MLATALPSPADRLEAAPRRDAAEAPTDAPAGPRFADLLQQRRAAAAPASGSEKPGTRAAASTDEAVTATGKPPRGGARTLAIQHGKDTDARETEAGGDHRRAGAIDLCGTHAAEATDGEAPKAPAAVADGGTGANQASPPIGVEPTLRVPAPNPARCSPTAVDAGAAPTLRVNSTPGAPKHDAPEAAEAGSAGAGVPKPAPTVDLQTVLPAPAPGDARAAPAAREGAPALPAGALPGAPRFADALAAPPPAVVLPAPLHAPEFAQVLGAQVSLFARDGLQQAELRINPPEMGPIGVQIELDGRDARVTFHAGQAATREVIERALPELAAALRSEGLTLAGGGVFDGSADSRHQPRAEAGPHAAHGSSTGAQGPDGQARAPALHAPQGMVDLYA